MAGSAWLRASWAGISKKPLDRHGRPCYNAGMEKQTKFVTVYWSEIIHRKNTIEVDKDEDDEDRMLLQAQIGSRICASEVETDSIEIVEE